MSSVQQIRSTAIIAATIFFFTGALSPAVAQPVTYTLAGTFDSTPTSGLDEFSLAGQPIGITFVGDETMVPAKQGTNYASFNGLQATATVHTGLVPTPITIQSRNTSIVLWKGPGFDFFEFGTNLHILKLTIAITGRVFMPQGTLTATTVSPFTAPVLLTFATAHLIYADSTDSSKLGMQGSLNAALSGAAATAAVTTDGVPAHTAAVVVHSNGAQAITLHPDGTQSVRPLHSSPVDLGAEGDSVALQFYVSGLGEGANVQVQIAGTEVPVLYAGKAAHFTGLDEVSVQLPRSLAGAGQADVVMTVDGRAANPVQIHIQ